MREDYHICLDKVSDEMACSQAWGHCVALHVYFVDAREHEVVENLNTTPYATARDIYPIIQVRATREETLASVIHRSSLLTHRPGGCPLGYSYHINDVTYNGYKLDFRALGQLPIGQVLSDPRTSLLILTGTLTIANCCCLNYCLVSCCTGGGPKYDGPKYVENVMNR